MKPIPRRLLPHTVTVYNIFKDMKTGKLSYYRTFLEHTRFIDHSSAVNVANVGWTRVVTVQQLVDPISTIAYMRDDAGNQITKIYADPVEWAALSSESKEGYWTLQEGDFIIPGECQIIIPANTIQELTALKPRKISAIKREIDKPGNVHHWELTLV